MAWGIPGNVGAILQDSVTEELTNQLVKQQVEQRVKEFAEQIRLREAELNEQQRENTGRERRLERGDRLDTAEKTLRVLDSMQDASQNVPAELTPTQAGPLRGTPFEARLRDTETLRARPHPALDPALESSIDPDPRAYTMLRPTSGQLEAQRTFRDEREQRESLEGMARDPQTPARLMRILRLRQAGVPTAPVGAETVKTEADRKAESDAEFAEHKRRAQFSDSLIRGRQDDRPERIAFTPKDLIGLQRQFRADARGEYKALAGPTGKLTGPDGEIIPLEEFMDSYVDERMAEIEALMEQGAQPPPGGAGRRTPLIPIRPMSSRERPGQPSPQGLMRVKPPGVAPRNATPGAPQTGAGPAGRVLRYDAQGNLIR